MDLILLTHGKSQNSEIKTFMKISQSTESLFSEGSYTYNIQLYTYIYCYFPKNCNKFIHNVHKILNPENYLAIFLLSFVHQGVNEFNIKNANRSSQRRKVP